MGSSRLVHHRFGQAVPGLAGSADPAHEEEQEQPSVPCVTVVTAPNQVQPTMRLVVDNTRTSQPGLGPDETRRSA